MGKEEINKTIKQTNQRLDLDVPAGLLENLTFSIPIHPITHPSPISVPYSIEKHPILPRLGAFELFW